MASLIQNMLDSPSQKKKINLGNQIFGTDKWKALDGPVSETQLDPLTDMFSKQSELICFLVLRYT